ncbi:hypothetical protein AVEN_34516-1 [Araneus ventricosus]|uniref:Uncharacterized protein n=1 Tax=Araneus ventricosus TaxID=182803 RepID=A0A4Y2RCR8_ARAVE|nr:hypothetical protein AVEN_34516-1 [Araneus ventricosus]
MVFHRLPLEYLHLSLANANFKGNCWHFLSFDDPIIGMREIQNDSLCFTDSHGAFDLGGSLNQKCSLAPLLGNFGRKDELDLPTWVITLLLPALHLPCRNKSKGWVVIEPLLLRLSPK